MSESKLVTLNMCEGCGLLGIGDRCLQCGSIESRPALVVRLSPPWWKFWERDRFEIVLNDE